VERLCSLLNFVFLRLSTLSKRDLKVKDVPENPAGDARIIQKRNPVLELIILVLTAQWLLSFFGQSFFPGISHTGGFIYMLSVVIVALITMKFLSQL